MTTFLPTPAAPTAPAVLPKLQRSKDRKVTNAVTPAGAPAIANSIGLPSGRQYSCLDQTDYCALICYAGKLEKVYKGVSAVLLRNWEALKDASYADTVAMLSVMTEEFYRECEKRGADKLFRIHWDGDFFSGTYTAAWATVIAAYSDVRFWVYTRHAPAARYLHTRNLGNLALYFSADRDNASVAHALASEGVRIAYVGDTFAEGRAKFAGAVRCPENNGAMPLITSEGSACVRCGLCVNGRRDVLFSASKK